MERVNSQYRITLITDMPRSGQLAAVQLLEDGETGLGHEWEPDLPLLLLEGAETNEIGGSSSAVPRAS
jgi:hypothetical protein